MRRLPTIHPSSVLERVRFYNPYRDAAHRYPEWRIRAVNLGGRCSELIVTAEQTILVDPRNWRGDEPVAVAHAISHLDLHRANLGALSRIEEEEADRMAFYRLDQFAALV